MPILFFLSQSNFPCPCHRNQEVGMGSPSTMINPLSVLIPGSTYSSHQWPRTINLMQQDSTPTSQVIVPELGWQLRSWSEEGLELEELQPEPMRSGASPWCRGGLHPVRGCRWGLRGGGNCSPEQTQLVLKGNGNCCWKVAAGEPCVMLGFVTPRGEDFDPRSETRLDHLELFV